VEHDTDESTDSDNHTPVVYQLHPSLFRADFLEKIIYPDPNMEWFCSQEWDGELYALAARAGMISVSWKPFDDFWLISQMQTEYAVLDWNGRHMSKRMQRQVRNHNSRFDGASIVISRNLSATIKGIQERYSPECWLCPEYAGLIQSLAEKPQMGIQIFSTELRDNDGQIVAGELGYTIGSVYTCLTGFISNVSPGISWGKMQILALAELLAQHGYRFMNMGHTEQQYKHSLGAHILQRPQFLARWLPAIAFSPEKPLQFDKKYPLLPLLRSTICFSTK
jgi:hypothetical protein